MLSTVIFPSISISDLKYTIMLHGTLAGMLYGQMVSRRYQKSRTQISRCSQFYDSFYQKLHPYIDTFLSLALKYIETSYVSADVLLPTFECILLRAIYR